MAENDTPDDDSAPSHAPRELPSIPSNADFEQPPTDDNTATPLPVTDPPTVEQLDPGKAHWFKMDTLKTNFAIKFTAWNVFFVVSLSILGNYWPGPGNGSMLNSAIEILKLMATIGLGFIFGRSPNREG